MVINSSLRINTNFIKKTIKNTLNKNINDNLYFLDNYGNDIFNDKQKNVIKNNIIKDFFNEIDYNLYLSIDRNCCVYKFQKGKKCGEYCNRKIYIKTGNDVELYCSRHNDNYEKNIRKYIIHKRCDYIKENKEQCRNYSKYNGFCFTHKNSNCNIDPFIRLNKLRNIYYKKIKKKKHNIYFKQNKKENTKFNNTKNKYSQNVNIHQNNNNYFHHTQHMNNFDNTINLYVKRTNSILCKNFNIFQFQNMFKIKKKKKIKKQIHADLCDF